MKPAVDSREPSELKAVFTRAGWEEKPLVAGDYQFYDAVGEVVLVERKTVEQFLTDMTSGQLQRQARILAESTAFPILLIEGHWSQTNGLLPDGKHTWEQAWNQLQSLQDIGLRLQLTSSQAHTIERIFQLAEYYRKDYHPSVARHPSGDSRVATLSYIYGIDQVKAKAILEVYPTLGQVAGASLEELMAVKGIGPKLAERIWRFWR